MKPDKKQQYHLEPPKGLMNDPNGLVWFRDRYYVFFQWNRYKKDHSHKEWGMFCFENLTDWEFLGGAIQPGDTYDCSGVHSGSCLEIDGKLCAFYTGSRKDSEGKRSSSQCLAVSEDGLHFEKKGVVLTTPRGFTQHFRDPKVFRTRKNGYYMVLGGQQENGKGAVVLGSSEDGIHWKYSHILAMAREHEMIECPDLFAIDGQYVLLYCLQRRNNEEDQVLSAYSAYRLASFDEESGSFKAGDLEHDYEVLESGFDFFAPQTFEAPDGRRILFAWMSRMEEEEQERSFAKGDPRIHCLTLPRALELRDGKLYQRPIRELYTLLGKEYEIRGTREKGYVIRPDRRTWHLKLVGALGTSFSSGLHLKLGETELYWDGERILFTRQNWVRDEWENRSRKLESLTEIEIWSDVSSIEVFVNGGEAVFSARVFPMAEPAIAVTGMDEGAALTIREIREAKKETVKRKGGDSK